MLSVSAWTSAGTSIRPGNPLSLPGGQPQPIPAPLDDLAQGTYRDSAFLIREAVYAEQVSHARRLALTTDSHSDRDTAWLRGMPWNRASIDRNRDTGSV